MRQISLLCILNFLLSFAATNAQTQDKFLARIMISGAVSELGISSKEEVWVATKAGNVYYTNQIGDLWHFGPFGSKDDSSPTLGNTFERINFLSDDILILSGFLQDDGKQDFVYRSENHGKTWEKVRFGKSSWLDASFVNNNGKAWMSGNSQLIYHTTDYGKTWTSFDKVEPTGNLRFSTIHFSKDEKTGLFGSFWNVLYRTTDNCKTWEKLPTPLSQNKYQRLSKSDRPEIYKIRQFGNRYIINQQSKIYVTDSNAIDWKRLANVIDFEVTESEKLYVINSNSEVEMLDHNLNSLWKAKGTIAESVRAIGVRNENLFVLTFTALYKVNEQTFRKSELLTDEKPIDEPYSVIAFENDNYGFAGRDLLFKGKSDSKWSRIKTVDFDISNVTVFDNKLIVTDGSLRQHYQFNLNSKSLEKYDLPKTLFDLSSNPVEQFHIEIGSQGCFHSDNRIRSYVKNGNVFELDNVKSTANFLSSAVKSVASEKVDELVRVVDASRFHKTTLNDLQLSNKDIDGFNDFIDGEEKRIKKSGIERSPDQNLYSFPGENTDFNFYREKSKSLPLTPDDKVNEILDSEYGNWSTTTNWTRLIFVFKDKTKLIIENSDDKPNYLLVPWRVNFQGLTFKTNAIKFGEGINELTRGSLFSKTEADKNYAIFNIVDYLYRENLQKAN